MKKILFCPSPSVKELMNELLDADIISYKDIMTLKKDKETILDPNLLMDLRHNELKERRRILQDKTCKEESEGKYSISTNRNDNIQENLVIGDELKKYEKYLEKEKRKMNQLVLDIKQSGKKVNNGRKLKKERKTLIQNYDDDGASSSISSETLLVNDCADKTDISSFVLKQEGFSLDYEKEISDLSMIKNYVNSLDHLEEEFRKHCDDRVEIGQSNDLDVLFEQMDKLNKSIETKYNAAANLMTPYDEGIVDMRTVKNQISKGINNFPSSSKMSFTNQHLINKHEEGTGIEMKYNADEFTDAKDRTKDICVFKSESGKISSNIHQQNDDNDVITAKDCNENQKEDLQLKFRHNDRKCYLAKKYFIKWKNNTKFRIEKTSKNFTIANFRNAVESRFDTFISRLQMNVNRKQTKKAEKDEKTEVKPLSNSEKFRNRFKAQKNIIEEQRQILEEQRKKIIKLEKNDNRLKSDKVETKKFCAVVKVNNRNNFNEKKQNRDLNSNNQPAFLENMNKRAEERKDKREKLNELKLKREEEKLKLKLLEEERQKKRKEDEKYAAIQAEQMEYLRRILREETRKIETENIKEAERKLTQMNRELLLTNYLKLWKKTITERNVKKEAAKQIFDRNLKIKVIESFKHFAERQKSKKCRIAELYRKCKLQKKYWEIWYKKWMEQKQMNQVADDYNDLRLGKRALITIMWNRQQEQRIQDEYMLEAVSYNNRKLMWKGFQSLKCYPKLVYEEREREKRLRSWEEKVKEILPDFFIT